MGLFGGWAALERGYHAMTFDGPGQQAALFLQQLPFRHDWEAVLTPVVDAMVARPDVDPGRIALIGVSQAATGCRAPPPSSTASRPRSPTPAWSTCPPPGWSRCPASCAPSSGTRPRGTPSTRRWAGPSGSPGRPGPPCTSGASPTAWPAVRPSTCTRRSGGTGWATRSSRSPRPAARPPGAGQVHGRRGRQPPLRAHGPGRPRHPGVRLAGPSPQGWPGRLTQGNNAPWAAADAARPPPRPLSRNATPAARAAPTSGPATYTQ